MWRRNSRMYKTNNRKRRTMTRGVMRGAGDAYRAGWKHFLGNNKHFLGYERQHARQEDSNSVSRHEAGTEGPAAAATTAAEPATSMRSR